MKKISNNSFKINYISAAILMVYILSIIGEENVTADEVPAFFLKIAKNIPRFGRSEPNNDFFSKNYDEKGDDPKYLDTNEMNEITKRKIGFSPETETWTWKQFPLAIEGPPELWRTLAGYSRDPLYTKSSNDFNNELWSRDKRTNIMQQ